MKILNRKVEFQAYKDGICDIYYEDEEGKKNYKQQELHFDNRVLGFNRHYAAKAVQVEANRVIRVPKINNINIHDILEIKRVGKYSIELMQNIDEANPPSIDLTLKELEVLN